MESKMSQRFWCLLQKPAVRAQQCTVSPWPLLLAYKRYGYRSGLRPKFRHVASRDTWHEVIKLFSCLTQLSMKFQLLIKN